MNGQGEQVSRESTQPAAMKALEHHLSLRVDQLSPENAAIFRRLYGVPLRPEHMRRAAEALMKLFGQRWLALLEECSRLSLDPSGAMSPKYLPEVPEDDMVWVIIFISSRLDGFDQDSAYTIAQGVLTARRYGLHPTRLAFALRAQLKHVAGERDWRCVAITASNHLAEAGHLSTIADETYLLGQSYPDACAACRRLIHGKVLRKIAPPCNPTEKQKLHCIWIGKSNYGLKRKEWRACVSIHPDCRCYYGGPINTDNWWVDDKGHMQPRVGHAKEHQLWLMNQWFQGSRA